MINFSVNNSPKRLLCIVSSMNRGGAETFLMKMFRNVDRNNYIFDFCVTERGGAYEEEILSLGGKIFQYAKKSKHPIKSFAELRKIICDNSYDYVIRVNEHSLSTIDLIAARLGGAKHLIMRSSNAGSGSFMKRFTHRLFGFMPRIIPTVKIAPSIKAGEYTFGHGFELLNNGFPIEEYKFDTTARESYRAELNIADKLVVGHVGRFMTQKNHEYLIEIFAEIKKMKSNAILMLVGAGPLENKIKQQIDSMGLSDSVILLGQRDDVNKLYSAMDVFLFPSLYEGMPNTVLEAQASGLMCIISDSITAEAKVCDTVKFLGLNEPIIEWASMAVADYDRNKFAVDNLERLNDAGYDISDIVNRFTKLVFG